MPLLSIVSPVYRAEKIIPLLVEKIEINAKKITDDYEIILVEDCGGDDSWKVIQNIAISNSKVRGIKLSKNFGQHYAISAGLQQSKGNWTIVMDCDLQDNPDEFENLYNKAIEGYDIVLARRAQRNDAFFKRTFSKLFYWILSYLTGYKHDATIANYGIYSLKVIDTINSMSEYIRYFPTMVQWVGFTSTKIDVKHNAREEGSSSYNFKRLLNLGLDIILVNSDKPIRLLIKSGILVSIFSFGIAIYYFIKWFKGEIEVLGYASLVISIWLLSGFVIATLGVVGLYIGKIFGQVKQRPYFIIDKTINVDE